MAKLTDLELLENAIICLLRVKYYTKDSTEKQIEKDIKTQDAVCFCIQNFGKNISKISENFKNRNTMISKIEWARCSSFAMDNYFDLEDIWDVIYDKEYGIIELLTKLYPILMKSKKEQTTIKDDQSTKPKESLQLDTKYNYSIHSHSSIWTVKKR